MHPVGRPEQDRDGDVDEEDHEEEEVLDAARLEEGADQRLAEDRQHVQELRRGHGEHLGLRVPHEPVARGARDPDERQQGEPRDPADPPRAPESVGEEHLEAVERRREHGRIRGITVERAHQRPDPQGVRHDALDGLMRGIRADPVEEEEIDAGHERDRQREHRDGPGVIEGVQRSRDQAVQQHLDPLIGHTHRGEPAAVEGLRGPAGSGEHDEGGRRGRRARGARGRILGGARRGGLLGSGRVHGPYPSSFASRARSATWRSSGCASPRYVNASRPRASMRSTRFSWAISPSGSAAHWTP